MGPEQQPSAPVPPTPTPQPLPSVPPVEQAMPPASPAIASTPVQPIATPPPVAVTPVTAPVTQVPTAIPATPVPPMAPIAPVPSVGMPGGVAPVKGANKGLLWSIIGGAGLLLVIAIVLMVVFFGPPSKADYQKAYDKALSMKEDRNNTSFSAEDYNKLTTRAAVDEFYNKNRDRSDKNNNELRGMHAMSDSKVREAFEAYQEKYNSVMEKVRPLLYSTMYLRQITADCTLSSSSGLIGSATNKQAALNQFDNDNKTCIATLKKASEDGDRDITIYANSMLDFLDKFRTYIGDMADALGRGDYSYSRLEAPNADSIKIPANISATALSELSYSDEFDKFLDVLKSHL